MLTLGRTHLLLAVAVMGSPAALVAAEADDPEDLMALMAEVGVVEAREPLVNRERWAMRDLLARDFMQTRGVESRVARVLDPLALMRDESFLEAMEHDAALAALRPSLAHEARLAALEGVSYDIPIADHRLVDSYIDYFTGRGRFFFEKWLARSARYIPMMQPILESYGLPKDLVYLAMIESGFSSRATSFAAAAGFWQFIRTTGRIFNLKTDTWVDERRDFIAATHAAARYLQRLHDEFGDWYLAWASYNAGEGRIRRAVAKTGISDFWTLIDAKVLPKETQHYVPKIIAAAIVAKNAERYGFTGAGAQAPLAFDELLVDDSVDLRLLAKAIEAPVEDLRELNPQLAYDITPPNRRLKLRVPKGTTAAADAWIQSRPPAQRFSYNHHVVARGDTLSGIAKKFGTSIALVQEFNDIHNARGLRPGQQLIIPSLKRVHDAPVAVSVAPKSASRASAAEALTRQPTARHTVAAGETLWSISQRYKTSVEALKRWNGLRTSQVQAGAVLKIY